jgi:hypothetical protein
MDDNVIKLVKNQFDVSYDIAEFEQEMKELEILSPAKVHIQTLVADIATSENIDLEVRLDAARVLLESSDLFPIFFELEGGHEMLQQIIKDKLRDSVWH